MRHKGSNQHYKKENTKADFCSRNIGAYSLPSILKIETKELSFFLDANLKAWSSLATQAQVWA